MWTANRDILKADPNERRQAIGLSWFLGQHRGRRIVSHGGGDTGYITDLVMIPEGRKAVVWMANVDYIGQPPVTRAALDTVLGLTPEPIVSRRSAGRVLMATYKDGGLDAALKQYAAIKASQADLYDLDESALNSFGYFLLEEKKTDEAIRVFQPQNEGGLEGRPFRLTSRVHQPSHASANARDSPSPHAVFTRRS